MAYRRKIVRRACNEKWKELAKIIVCGGSTILLKSSPPTEVITDVRRKSDLPWTAVYDPCYFTDGMDLQAAPWLSRLVAGLSPLTADFDPTPAHVGIFVGQSGTGTGFSPSIWGFNL